MDNTLAQEAYNPAMVDSLTKEERSERMRRIRGKDTKPEIVVRKLLYSMGYRYRLHGRGLPGHPDIVFKGRKKVVFVHGCFWHMHENCKVAHVPKSKTKYWEEKFTRNRARDIESLEQLKDMGWGVLVIWECELAEINIIKERLSQFLGSQTNLSSN